MTHAWTISLALWAASGAAPPVDPASAQTPGIRSATHISLAVHIRFAVLHADGFADRDALERAIALRLPGLTLAADAASAPPPDDGALRAFIELQHRDAAVRLSLILSDGRAYLRELEVDADAPVRPTAGALANLIAAIEDDTAVPDR